MINILIIDDEVDILDVEKRIVSRYFQNNDIDEFVIDTALNGKIAIDMIEQKEYNLLFLDYMMPVSSGLDVLEHIRFKNTDKHQPYICMVTAMGTSENLELFRSRKASSYIIKPFNMKTINLMLDTYIKPIVYENKEKLEVDEFVDFDDFEDFDDFDSLDDNDITVSDEEKNIMTKNNLNHKKVPAIDFLKDIEGLEYILDDVNEIDELLVDIIEFLEDDTLEHYKIDINTAFSLYIAFLRSLSDFDEFANTLEYTKDLVESVDIDNYDEKKKQYIIEIIRSILKDISYWKEAVFISKKAIDVFYIGASSYNSYLQLKELISSTKTA